MSTEHVRLFAWVVLDKTLPSWLRGHGYMLLAGDYVPGWEGPELPGWKVVCAATHHCDCCNMDDATSIWFLLPDGAYEFFSDERLLTAAQYVVNRLHRRAHRPKEQFTFVGIPTGSPGSN